MRRGWGEGEREWMFGGCNLHLPLLSRRCRQNLKRHMGASQFGLLWWVSRRYLSLWSFSRSGKLEGIDGNIALPSRYLGLLAYLVQFDSSKPGSNMHGKGPITTVFSLVPTLTRQVPVYPEFASLSGLALSFGSFTLRFAPA